ncbi:MAG: O-antigen ligase family protein [Xanthomonadales bacterium]|nr:O-antigen ligase family protein [Xanthomonadales bacterium]
MNLLLKRLQADWPCWLAVSFFALLPFGRLAEIPLSAFALCLPFLARSAVHRQRIRQVSVIVVPIFLCFWIPMVVSSFDSYLPQKSWVSSLAALRFLAAVLSMAVLLRADSARWRVIRWTSFLLVFWAVDGFVQLIFGNDLFGIAMNPDRLNALFVQKYQFYGPTLAMLSPLLLEHARRHWPAWAWVTAFTLMLGAVLIAGMRAGWLIMGLVLAVYLWLMFKRENRELRKASLSIPVLVVTAIIGSYLVSPLFQARLDQSLTITQGTQAAVSAASNLRIPIFKTSLIMYKEHPVNGVGVRAFPVAYMEYAADDDVHIQNSGGKSGATHAHNLVLEVMADTGSIGLLGMIAGFVLVLRFWRQMTPTRRNEAFPFALALALVLFPLNSHFALYGTYMSSLIWVLFGLWAASIETKPA